MRLHFARRSLIIAALLLLVGAAALAANVDIDSRFERPVPPESLNELVARFLPNHVPLTPQGSVRLAEGEAYAFNQSVTAGVCYAFVAIGLNGLTDLDLRLRRRGGVVAQDVQLDGYPVVEWCPALSGIVRVGLRAFNGGGTADFQVLVDPNAYYSARGQLDELSNRLEAATARSAPRWTPEGAQWRSAFPRPGVRQLTIDAEPGECYAVIAVGQASVLDVDLRMRADGEVIDQDVGGGAVGGVSMCASVSQTLTVDVALVRGQGVVAAQPLRHALPL
ncbi:MAG: hypothetical protein ACJAYU_002382 [Bradymonadia bacterium]|jgi:hypothetical protein